MTRVAAWLEQALHSRPDLTDDQRAFVAELVDLATRQPRVDHELTVWRLRADVYGTRMTLAEAVCRHLHAPQVPQRARGAFAAWEAEYERQTGEPAHTRGAA